jgi:hypothetical protein
MIVKLGMDVDQCIDAYQDLARKIFGKPRRIGVLTLGFGVPRFSSRRLRKVIVELVDDRKGAGKRYQMEDEHEPAHLIW